ncbi:MAG: hypothetical protein CV081_12570 [Nitrospira sp. LK265]|nr:hypothetical protein [Nitrospira sp. LK265]
MSVVSEDTASKRSALAAVRSNGLLSHSLLESDQVSINVQDRELPDSSGLQLQASVGMDNRFGRVRFK